MKELTETIYTKHVFTDKEQLELARKMARAEAVISEKTDELKSATTTIKADIAIQEGILHSSSEKLRSGYEMRQREALVVYKDGIAKFLDKETGELLEERPLSEDEQLRLTGKRVDAEKLVRQDEEDSEDE